MFEVSMQSEALICKLKKSFYGLKQSRRNWFYTLRDFLESIGFKAGKSDPCLFLRLCHGVTDYVACWVDDLVYCSGDKIFYKEFEMVLSRKFLVSEITYLN